MHLMESLGNMNHAISTIGYWIFDSNYEQSHCLKIEPLYLIFSPLVDEEQVVKFETVFFAVRHM